MKRMNKKYVAGTAFALGAALSLAGCCVPMPQPSVYGPAPSNEVETTREAGTPADIFDETEEYQEAVYGPPEYFEPEAEVQEDVYGPPEFFEPEEEVQEDVYGPPEFFGEEEG